MQLLCTLFLSLLSGCVGTKEPVISNSQNIVKIGIIDSGVNKAQLKDYLCNTGHRDYTGTGLQDDLGHGTNVAGLVTILALNSGLKKGQFCLVIYKIFTRQEESVKHLVVDALLQAIEDKIDILNMSYGGVDFYLPEYKAMNLANRAKIVLVVAAGNDGANLNKNCTYYPACYGQSNTFGSRTFKKLNMLVVGNGKNSSNRHRSSNFGSMVNLWFDGCKLRSVNGTMCGTSMSAAIASGLAAKIIYDKFYAAKDIKSNE